MELMSKAQRYALWGLLFLAAIILFLKLGSYPLQMQWEPNYGQVMREMTMGEGDFITPASRSGNDEGAKRGEFWSKPILIFWLAYPAAKLFGVNEWTLRLPIAAVGFLGIWFFYFFMQRLYDRQTGLIGAAILMTTPCYYLISRAYMVDTPFVVFQTMAIGSLLLGEKEGKPYWYYLFWAFLGVSTLAKGLLPVMLTGSSVFLYCLFSGEWRLLRRMRFGTGLLVYFIVALPWYGYMTGKFGLPYLKKFFWDHHVQRTMGKLDKPDDSFQMFVLYFSVGVLPWLTFLPRAIFRAIPWDRKQADKNPELFFVVGFLFIFGFFSAISTKFVHYIFPSVPFAVALIAIDIRRALNENDADNINRMSFFLALLVLIIAAPDLLDQKNYRTLFYFITTERLQDWHPNVADPRFVLGIILTLWGVLLGVMALFRRFVWQAIVAFVLLGAAYGIYINSAHIPQLTRMFSADSMMTYYLEHRQGPEEPIAEFTQTWKSRSIKYYMPFDEQWHNYNYRGYRLRNNVASIRRFHDKYRGKRVFIIIEQKQKHFSRINQLWQEVSGGEKLVKVFDDTVPGQPYKPEFWVVSNRSEDGAREVVTKEEINRVLKNFVSTENTFQMETPSTAVFDDNIELVGYSLNGTKAKVGTKHKISLLFHAKTKPKRDFMIFIHADHEQKFRLRGDHVPVNDRYPMRRWKEGEYILDDYELTIPSKTPEIELKVYMGLYKGAYRAKITGTKDNTPDDRLLLGSLMLTK